MKKKNVKEIFNVNALVDDIRAQVIDESHRVGPYIPDIIEFCYSRRYLDLKNHGVTLYPMQQIILKSFYRGQPGNEHLKLTPDELNLLKHEHMDDVLEKYYSGHLFRELVLVLGRRAGKDFMTSLIALYEAMTLLELPGGDPIKYYGISEGQPIYIITIATAADQARILYEEIKNKLQSSPYFRNKIGHMDHDRIWLMTPADREKKKELAASGLKTAADDVHGTVVFMSGHSNSDSLLGKRYYTLLFDEVASYKLASSVQSGDRLYTALAPGQSDFNRLVGHDADGQEIRRMDAKIISISSPRGEEGILYKMFKQAPFVENRLAFRLPTWRVNLAITENLVRSQNKFMSEADFRMEFGAEFSSTAGEKFISDQYVDRAFDLGGELGDKHLGIRGMAYYAHLDPATRSDNYALIIMHYEDALAIREDERGIRRKERRKYFIVDHMKTWKPSITEEVNVKEVDEYIIALAKRFRLVSVTYDAWQSTSSIQLLRRHGIPARETAFRSKYKMQIYDNVHELLVAGSLILPKKSAEAVLLELELKNLRKIYTPTGFNIQANEEGEVSTDDLCDALAGAVGASMDKAYTGYPRPALAYMPQPGSNNQMWSIGSGQFTNANWRWMHRKFSY